MMAAVEAVKAVEVVQKAKQRINIKTNLTFYSKNDLWYYFTITADDHLCETCQGYDNKIFFGSSLRGEFPWHEVNDEFIIKPKVHPNCRCILVRAIDVQLEPNELTDE